MEQYHSFKNKMVKRVNFAFFTTNFSTYTKLNVRHINVSALANYVKESFCISC